MNVKSKNNYLINRYHYEIMFLAMAIFYLEIRYLFYGIEGYSDHLIIMFWIFRKIILEIYASKVNIINPNGEFSLINVILYLF